MRDYRVSGKDTVVFQTISKLSAGHKHIHFTCQNAGLKQLRKSKGSSGPSADPSKEITRRRRQQKRVFIKSDFSFFKTLGR